MMTEKHEQIESQNKKLADDMWVAIVDMCPLNEWIPLRRDVELATDILKMFIDFDCYGENFSLVLKPDFSSFMKRPRDFNGYKTKNTAKNGNECGNKCATKVTDHRFRVNTEILQPTEKDSAS